MENQEYQVYLVLHLAIGTWSLGLLKSMSSIAFVGLPNAGKSTFFKLLSRLEVAIASYPFTTLKPHRALVPLLDDRLDQLVRVSGSHEKVFAPLEFVDLPGLVKGAHRGEGMGNEFLSYCRTADLIIQLIRCFRVPQDEHQLLEPLGDFAALNLELALSDIAILESAKVKLQRDSRFDPSVKEHRAVVDEALERLRKGEWLIRFAEDEFLRGYHLITTKPVLVCLNVDEGFDAAGWDALREEVRRMTFADVVPLNVKLELELEELKDEQLKREFAKARGEGVESVSDFLACIKGVLDLVTFYTFNEKEARAWLIEGGSSAVRAAGLVHSDFADRFLHVEVIPVDSFLDAGSWQKAREMGIVRKEGKEYGIHDGDIVLFKTF